MCIMVVCFQGVHVYGFTINSSLHDSMNSIEEVTIVHVSQPSAYSQESAHLLKLQVVNVVASIQMYTF